MDACENGCGYSSDQEDSSSQYAFAHSIPSCYRQPSVPEHEVLPLAPAPTACHISRPSSGHPPDCHPPLSIDNLIPSPPHTTMASQQDHVGKQSGEGRAILISLSLFPFIHPPHIQSTRCRSRKTPTTPRHMAPLRAAASLPTPTSRVLEPVLILILVNPTRRGLLVLSSRRGVLLRRIRRIKQ